MLLNNIIRLSSISAFLLSMPTWSADDIDARVAEMRKQMDATFKPMEEYASKLLELATPWTQTLKHHQENGSLTQDVLEQIKEDARKQGYTLDLSSFEEMVRNQEQERKKIELAKESFLNSAQERLIKHIQDSTLTQQILDTLREEGRRVGVDLVLQGLPPHLH